MATGISPREFALKNKVVKFPWPYRAPYFVKKTKKKTSFDSPWFGFSYGALTLFIPHW